MIRSVHDCSLLWVCVLEWKNLDISNFNKPSTNTISFHIFSQILKLLHESELILQFADEDPKKANTNIHCIRMFRLLYWQLQSRANIFSHFVFIYSFDILGACFQLRQSYQINKIWYLKQCQWVDEVALLFYVSLLDWRSPHLENILQPVEWQNKVKSERKKCYVKCACYSHKSILLIKFVCIFRELIFSFVFVWICYFFFLSLFCWIKNFILQ